MASFFEELVSAAASKGLKIPQNHEFQKYNLVIGENGSGKSRYLSALKECFLSGDTPVIYFDFPKIKPDYVSKSDTTNTNKKMFYSYIYVKHGDIDKELLADFIVAIEENYRFLYELILGIADDEVKEKTIQEINNSLKGFSSKSLRITKESVETSRNDNEYVPLDTGLGEMSPGERLIFYFVIAIELISRVSNKEVVVLMDEPESHLHPKVLVKLIEKVKELPNIKYIFIASHSVFLIPHFQFEEHIYMKGGEVMKINSKLYRDLYGDLIGIEEKDKGSKLSLYDFIASVETWEYISFMAECFVGPEVTEKCDPEDGQGMALVNTLSEKFKGRAISILDYGCGKGRIGAYLSRFSGDLKNTISYFVYEPELSDQEKRELGEKIPLLKSIYVDKEIESQTEAFDVVLLFNVLHEIYIKDWEPVLNRILSLIKPDGYIIFSERRVLTRGERPNSNCGYILFNLDELKTLFGISISMDAELRKCSEKIHIFPIPKNACRKKIGTSAIKNSLEKLSKRCKTYIDAYNDSGSDCTPREYAFYCQQYFNAEHALNLVPWSLPAGYEMWSFADILDYKSEERRILVMEERAKGSGKVAEECRKYLTGKSK